jgi:superfamily II DNA/RNA helicase
MLSRFFRNDQNHANHRARSARRWRQSGSLWRFKGHAEEPFWRWVCSWARAIRRPSDLGFDDARFVLPPLNEIEHVVSARAQRPDLLFDLPAMGLHEQREERNRTIDERCEKVATLIEHEDQALVWCHLNAEGDRLESLIPDAVQVRGSDSNDAKETALYDFATGKTRVLITKPKIGAWGLNLQRCAHITFFPSHSYEQYYQGVRRCWRFGQRRPVRVDVITTDGERKVMANLRRKAEQADRMFGHLVAHMNEALAIRTGSRFDRPTEVPQWL